MARRLHVVAGQPDATRLLLEHGADPNARDVGDNALPLHFAAGGGHLDSVRALLDAGSDVQCSGDVHRLDVIGCATVFEEPHREAMRLLHAAGAREPSSPETLTTAETLASLRRSIGKLTPMLGVPDMAGTIAWYESIGWVLAGSNGEDSKLDWASVRFGDAEIMFVPSSEPWRGATSALSLWIRTDRLDDLYSLLKQRRKRAARCPRGDRRGGVAAVSATVRGTVPRTRKRHGLSKTAMCRGHRHGHAYGSGDGRARKRDRAWPCLWLRGRRLTKGFSRCRAGRRPQPLDRL